MSFYPSPPHDDSNSSPFQPSYHLPSKPHHSSSFHLPSPPSTSHGTQLMGRPIHFISGQFANRTIRAEIHEIQKADLGRKCVPYPCFNLAQSCHASCRCKDMPEWIGGRLIHHLSSNYGSLRHSMQVLNRRWSEKSIITSRCLNDVVEARMTERLYCKHLHRVGR